MYICVCVNVCMYINLYLHASNMFLFFISFCIKVIIEILQTTVKIMPSSDSPVWHVRTNTYFDTVRPPKIILTFH